MILEGAGKHSAGPSGLIEAPGLGCKDIKFVHRFEVNHIERSLLLDGLADHALVDVVRILQKIDELCDVFEMHGGDEADVGR